MSWPELAGAAALGLAAGAVGSGLGVGTGGLVVPGLVLLFGLTEAGAQGTSLLVHRIEELGKTPCLVGIASR